MGRCTKFTEEGVDYQFQVIEHTEFIDDASFQPFKGGKMEPYAKRCASTKITSAEKLMYICKNQLGIEKEYEQKVCVKRYFLYFLKTHLSSINKLNLSLLITFYNNCR